MEKNLEQYFDRLWPLCRSITGEGLRDSLRILQEIIPLTLHEVPTGTPVFDWEIPKEWSIRDAWIKAPDGEVYADFKRNNLHVVNYSVPVHKKMSYEELIRHLHHLHELPEAIPYITSYYSESWGFCLSHKDFLQLPKNGEYEVLIDSELQSGSLTFGELVLPGETDREILFSTYVCHPSMANNELAGPLAAAFLYKKIAELPRRRYTYRFVFAPETIGVIAYLARTGLHLKEKLDAGYVLTCCGDPGDFTYKRSKRGDSLADRAAEHVLRHSGKAHRILDFEIGGSDERQYCSAGFNLPVGSLMRTPYKEYKEYHTSLDNKSFISFSALQETIDMYFHFVRALELNERHTIAMPWCEPQLGKRGLYPKQGGKIRRHDDILNLLHFISYADGSLDLLAIADKRPASIGEFEWIVGACREKGLL